jgi:hypothetical protein
LIVIKGWHLIEVKRKGIDGRRWRLVVHYALKEGIEGGKARETRGNSRRRRGGCRAGEVLEEGGGADMRAQAVGESREREREGEGSWAAGLVGRTSLLGCGY